MNRDQPWTDEYTLLCEKCGYVIEGLDTGGNCPECGKPIAESLPERRVGTPWQQSPGFKSLVKTWWMTLRHPLRTLDVMRIDTGQSESLQITDSACSFLIVMAGSFTTLLNIGSLVKDGVRSDTEALIFRLAIATAFALLCIVLYALLTMIEARGLRIIGRSRAIRITPTIATVIVAHGYTGWVIASLSIGMFAALLGMRDIGVLDVQDVVLLGIPVVCALLGFLFFETFAYLGLRRLKFANRVRPNHT